MLCLYVYNVLPPQRLPGSFEDSLCNGQRKIKETRFKKKKKKKNCQRQSSVTWEPVFNKKKKKKKKKITVTVEVHGIEC